MKRGFARPTPAPAPTVKPENLGLPTPLSVPPPEEKPWWLVIIGVVVVGLVVGMVAMTVASGSRMFLGAGSIFPIFMIGGVAMMMFSGRFGGGQQQMSRPKLDAMRGQFMVMLDRLRQTAGESADSMDANYRWFHPAPRSLIASVGSGRMWERRPDGMDLNFGVVRVGVGMVRPEVTWGEPNDMPTDIELEPVTGKALQEFGHFQSVVYNLPKTVSLLAEPGYGLVGERDQVLGLMRALVCQLAFSHGPDHLRMIIVSSQIDDWDWVKWLPHFGDPRRHDAAGSARMVYGSVQDFGAEHGELFAGRGSFMPRFANAQSELPTPHYVIIADVASEEWSYAISADGIDGMTFFDLTADSVPACATPERTLRFTNDLGVIEALPRDRDTFMVIDDKAWFFALTDQISELDAERFAQRMARWRLAEAYEEIGQRVAHISARDILSYYGIDDASSIDFDSLWASRRELLSRDRLRIPFGNRSDNGELLFLDMKSLDEGGDGPHGVMSGTTGSGKSTLVRTVIESLMLAHSPDELQFVLADLKGGSAVKPFAGVPHVSRIITDLEEDQALMERFLEAMWGEIARRKSVCDTAGADDAREYNEIRGRMRARGDDMEPLPMLVVVIDEFYEWFRIMPTAVEVLDSIGRQGRAYWIHLMMASQTIESRAEKLMENMGYRLVLKARTAGAAQAAGVPNAVNLPAQAGLGYFRKSGEEVIRFQAEFLWRDYRRGRSIIDEHTPLTHTVDYIRPQLFTTGFTPVEVAIGGQDVESAADEALPVVDSAEEDLEEEQHIRTPKVGTVIIDQLRRIDFEPYRLWQPPLDVPRPIDELVNRFLGHPWQENYGADANLVFPIGVIDRPYKHDQPPWTVDTSGPGANLLILGAGGAGKTTALQTLICSAALTHTPAQVQFYCLAYSGTALTTVAGLPHVGGVAGPTDPDGVRRTVAEMLALVRDRKRSFLEYDVPSMEVYRARKFGGDPGRVPDDGYADVFLVIDNYRALAEDNEVLIEQVNQIINQGPSFGVHVVVTADRESELRPPVRSGFGSRIELRLAAVEDAKLVRSRFAKDVPVKPGRGMVPVNYVRLDSDPQSGLHTLVARPALASTSEKVFESDSIAAAVAQVATGRARPVRRLPSWFGLDQLRELAAADHREGVGAGGIAWAISELDLQPVYLNFAENSHLMVTGRRECGRTTTLATIMAEISRVYAPGGSVAPPTTRPSAQVWLIDPRRQLLTSLGSDYIERFAYNLDGVNALVDELAATLAGREPPPGLTAEELMSQSWWSGPEIFLIIDDIQQLPAGFDSPLHKAAAWINRASDVGLHVIATRTFGGWASAGSDPVLRALHQANTPLLVMDADPDEGFIRGRMKGGPLPRGRGLLMAEDTGVFVQVAATELRKPALTGEQSIVQP